MALFFLMAGGVGAIVLGGLTALQRSFMYPAPRDPVEPTLPGSRLHRIAGAEGRTVYALHVPAVPDAPTLVHFHGNGEALADQAPLAAALRRAGLSVFAIEYPGYGLAAHDGRPGEAAIYADAEAALLYLQHSLGIPVDRIVLQGQSLGSGVATEMARRGHAARMVLISPFTSMVDMARRLVPFFPASLVTDRYDSAAKAPAIPIPVLVIHGARDDLVPVDMGRRLAVLFPRAELYVSANAGHNDLFLLDGAEILKRIARFAERARAPLAPR